MVVLMCNVARLQLERKGVDIDVDRVGAVVVGARVVGAGWWAHRCSSVRYTLGPGTERRAGPLGSTGAHRCVLDGVL